MSFIQNVKNRLIRDTDKQGFEYTVTELVNMYSANQKLSGTFGKVLDHEFLSRKKSDTLFLLGSGPSINDLSEADFEIIGKHDSVGFNYWFAHFFVPSFYMFQLPVDNQKPLIDLFYSRQADYNGVPFILRGSALAGDKIDFEIDELKFLKKQDIYFLNEYPISSKCSIDIDLLIDYMEILGLMEFGNVGKLVPKWRGTLGLLISLGYQMGYKKIVLCGMDMQDNYHFWNHPQYDEIKNLYGLPHEDEVHELTNVKRSPNTVPQYVYKLAEWMKRKNGVAMYVASPRTVLHPRLPLFPFGNQ